MQSGAAQITIHALVALCLILTGLSPACHFKSGDTSFIEICKADGSVATVEVPASLDPFTDNAPKKHLPKAQKECSFCFAQTHINADLPKPPAPLAAIQSESYPPAQIWHGSNHNAHNPTNPRAPPVLI